MTTELTHITQRPPSQQSREMGLLLANYRNALERTGGLWSISEQRAPAGADRAALEARLAELTRADTRSDVRVIASRIARLFFRYPSFRVTDSNAEAMVATYAADLQHFPMWAIDQALMAAVERGGEFAPSSPSLRAACENIIAQVRNEIADIRAVLDAEIYREPSAEEKAEIVEQFHALAKELGMRDEWRSGSGVKGIPTEAEAKSWLERYEAKPPPVPTLSDALRVKLGLLPPDEQQASQRTA
jgi:hypothetical protein